MNKSESIAKLALALSKFQKALRPAVKDRKNPFFKSQYATLESVWAAIKDPLAENELAVLQGVSGETLNTMLLHSSGEWISSDTPLYLKSKSSQELGSAISYARRYSISAMLGVVDAEDDDGEAAEGRERTDPASSFKPPSSPASGAGASSKGATLDTRPVTEAMLKRLFAISNKAGLDDAAVKDLALALGHHGSRKDMNRDTYDRLCNAILNLP